MAKTTETVNNTVTAVNDPEVTIQKTVPTATNSYPGEKLVRVRIPHTRDDDDGDVFVSVNDRNWYIKRGVEVEIPECAAEVLVRREDRISEALAYENKRGKTE